jgi:hypothetical protein
MVKRLRRAGLPIVVSAVVAVVAVAGTIVTGGTASARTAARTDPGILAIQQAAADAGKHAVAKPRNLPTARAATDERGFGDLTGDGKADLAAVDSGGTLWVYPGKQYRWDGTGTRSTSLFGTRIQVGKGWGVFTSLARHGDLNGDGHQDVLARDSSGLLFFYPGTGDPAGMFGNRVQIGKGWGAFTSIVSAGDLTTDGKDDVLAAKSTGELLLYPGDGRARLGAARVIGSGWKGGPITAIGDWTYDFRTEIMFRNTAGNVRNYESRPGDLPIGKSEPVLDAAAGGALLNIVGMGDLTSDLEFEPISDVILQGKDGSLVLYTWDWSPASPAATKISSGWANYRLF